MKAERRPARDRGNKNTAPVRDGKGYWFSGLMFVLLSGVAAAGYWQTSELHKTLADTRQALEQTREQLTQVTGQVSQTGLNVTQSDSTFRGELKVVNSEIRKLWDVANKRNRQWITENKENIEKLHRRVDEVAKHVSEKLSEIDQVVKALASEQLEANSALTVNVEALKSEIASLQQLVAAQKAWEERLKASSATQEELSKKLSSFQSQTSLRLRQMENTVRELGQPKDAAELTIQ